MNENCVECAQYRALIERARAEGDYLVIPLLEMDYLSHLYTAHVDEGPIEGEARDGK